MLVIAEVIGDLALERRLQQPLGQLLKHPTITGQLQPASLRAAHQLLNQLLVQAVQPELAHPPGADRTQASAINDHGVAVGSSGDSALSWQHAVRWDLGGVPTDLGVLGDDWLSSASSINASGVVVGSSTTANWITRPVRWSADGTISEMDRPAGYTTAYPEAINEAGLAAGYGGGSGRSRALKWAADGSVVELEPLPGEYTVSMAEGIGHDGTVVGNSQGGGLRPCATRWNPDGTVTDLGQLPGGYGSRAIAVNRHGVVVGTARDANAVDHAASAVAGGEDFQFSPVGDGAFDRDSQGGDAVVPDRGGRVVVGVTGAFAAWSDHISALIAQVTEGAGEELVVSGGGEPGPVMRAARDGCGHGQELAVQVGEDLDVHSGFVPFAGVVRFMSHAIDATVADRDEGAVHEHHPAAQHLR